MDPHSEPYKLALISYVELVLMRRGNANYHLVMARLGSLYGCKISDCYEHPEYLKTVLKDVYQEDYKSIVSQIKSYLAELANVKEIVDFFKIMES
ncbi:MAG TPA: hypothetical protein VFA69_02030 [Candidatus Nitrosotalea sp.]|nr:hypothetical protein [Candidatus Nitrosotalea sp.]